MQKVSLINLLKNKYPLLHEFTLIRQKGVIINTCFNGVKDKSGEWKEKNKTESLIKTKNLPTKIVNSINEQLLDFVKKILKNVK